MVRKTGHRRRTRKKQCHEEEGDEKGQKEKGKEESQEDEGREVGRKKDGERGRSGGGG